MSTTEQIIKKCAEKSQSRFELWIEFIQLAKVQYMVEVGVYRGDFASKILERCDALKKYYMIDPWRHLEDWNKPANEDDKLFEQYLSETKEKTDFAAEKRIILRGKTTEVIEAIPDDELDFAYIDGDHTLRGIAIDLMRVYPKVRDGGFVAGDDFSRTIWQHHTNFEPTFVFPFAVYFAESVGAHIYALQNAQFLIEKTNSYSFAFIDLTGHYNDISLRDQFHPDKTLKLKMAEMFPRVMRFARKAKGSILK